MRYLLVCLVLVGCSSPIGQKAKDLGPKAPETKAPETKALGPKAPETKDLGPKDLGPKDLGPKDLGPKDLGPKDLGPKVPKDVQFRYSPPRSFPVINLNGPLIFSPKRHFTPEELDKAKRFNAYITDVEKSLENLRVRLVVVKDDDGTPLGQFLSEGPIHVEGNSIDFNQLGNAKRGTWEGKYEILELNP